MTHSFHSVAICSFVGGPQNVKSQTQMSKNISSYLFPHFIKSTPPYPCYIKQYIGIQKISVHVEEWYL